IAGLTGEQGVMIPASNLRHLMLSDEVIGAVKEGKFSVWAVNDIDEGLEILTGTSAGKPRKDGSYNDKTVHGLVKSRLKKMLSDGMRLEKKFSRSPRRKSKKKSQKAPENG
ncbi:MAG: ATP-dependent protease, partial [Synergistaceae bacterium]|nr:ATP-dependent protease [Synergistaceae bacterium]